MRRDPAIRRSFAHDLALAFFILLALRAIGALTGTNDEQPLSVIVWLAQLIVFIIAIRWVIYEVCPAWSDKTLDSNRP